MLSLTERASMLSIHNSFELVKKFLQLRKKNQILISWTIIIEQEINYKLITEIKIFSNLLVLI